MQCLITKLKGSVNDDSLPKLGEAVIEGVEYDTQASILSLNISPRESGVVCRVSGTGTYLTLGDSESHLSEAEIPVSNTTIKIYNPSFSDIRIFFSKKSAIKYFGFNQTNTVKFPLYLLNQFTTIEKVGASSDYRISNSIYGDIIYLKKFSNMQQLFLLGQTGIYGDISVFKDMINMKNISLGYAKVSGDISNLGKLTKCVQFNFADTQVSGKLEDLCQSLYDNGLTSGTITVNFQRSAVTYQDSPISSGHTATFNNDGYTIN